MTWMGVRTQNNESITFLEANIGGGNRRKERADPGKMQISTIIGISGQHHLVSAYPLGQWSPTFFGARDQFCGSQAEALGGGVCW